MGGEAAAGKAEERQEGPRNAWGQGGRGRVRVAEGGKEQHMERKEKAESVSSDKQEIIRQGFLKQM